jgi:hypothetical protein
LPLLSRDPKIRKAQRIIEAVMAEKESAPAVVQKPWAEMSRGEKLAAAADKGLGVAMKTLELEVDPTDIKLLALQNNTALSVISYQIRVEQAPREFSPPAEPSISLEELADRASREIEEAFREYQPPVTERQSADAPARLRSPSAQAQEEDKPSRDYARPGDMSDVTLDDVVSRTRRRQSRWPRGPGSAWGA